MKRKELLGILEQVDGFESPNIRLEQYVTSPEIAAAMVMEVESELEEKKVLDLGCGTGVLSVASALVGAGSVLGVDIDGGALAIARRNLDDIELENVDLLQADVLALPSILSEASTSTFDVVIMNPPFGTKNNAGMDKKFLEVGFSLAPTVFSLHKTATRNFLQKYARDSNLDFQVLAELRYDLPASYKFHKSPSRDIQVDFIRFSRHPV